MNYSLKQFTRSVDSFMFLVGQTGKIINLA